MMCCGVLPIDTMKDYISPISLIIHRVPRGVLEEQYKIQLPAAESKNYSASMFLQILGAKKGLVTGRGLPNEAMAARFVLKDYVNGRLLFCHIRPDYDRETHGEIVQSDTTNLVLFKLTLHILIKRAKSLYYTNISPSCPGY